MKVVYDSKLNKFLVVWTPNININREKWNKPVNNSMYDTWEDANNYIDRIESMGY